MSARLVVDNDDPLVNSALALLEARRRLKQICGATGRSEALADVYVARQAFHKEFSADVERERHD